MKEKKPSQKASKKELEIIQQAARRVRQYYTFDIHDIEDIEQEAILIGLSVLDKWDGKRPLLNFMLVSMRNRLINFINSKRSHSEIIKKKKLKLENTVDISKEEIPISHNDFENIETEEIFAIIENLVPYHMRLDYLKLRDGIYIPAPRRRAIIEEIRTKMQTSVLSSFIKRFLEDEDLWD